MKRKGVPVKTIIYDLGALLLKGRGKVRHISMHDSFNNAFAAYIEYTLFPSETGKLLCGSDIE